MTVRLDGSACSRHLFGYECDVGAAPRRAGSRLPRVRLREYRSICTKLDAYDGLGSVLGEVDPLGNLTASRKYDVYGLVRAGDSGTSRHKFVGSLGHTSEDETGLVYMRARWMDPSLGRFISEDPARDGANWFDYCRGNPVNAVDPDGKQFRFPWEARAGSWVAGLACWANAVELLLLGGWTKATALAAIPWLEASALFFSGAAICLPDAASLGMLLVDAGELVFLHKATASMAVGSAAGLKTQAGVAIAALMLEALIEIGYLLSIGEDA